jgi:hypothetical protein
MKAMRRRIALRKHFVQNGERANPVSRSFGVRARPRAAFRLPLAFFQLLPYVAFFVPNVAQLALEKR